MKTTHTKTLLTALATTACVGFAHAGTIDPSSSFNVDPTTTSIDTTGDNVVDWGYFLPNADFLAGTQAANTNFDALVADNQSVNPDYLGPATNSKAVSGIGAVTITERDAAEYSNGSTSLWQFTVDDGLAPVSGTYTPLGAANGIAGSEDIFNITFNDLGAGTTTVTLYMAHSNTGRKFDATVDLTAADGNAADAETSVAIGGTGGTTYFTYTAVVTTTDANADLSISIDSNSGGSGQFAFAGYTVTSPIPEPGSLALLGLGGLLVASRRRRG